MRTDLGEPLGPDDNSDLEDSHVISAMINKYVSAKDAGMEEVVLWGTGKPSREFLYVNDAARAVVLSAELAKSSEPFNIGTGIKTKISEVSATVSAAVGYEGGTTWDTSRPDGQPVKSLDVTQAIEMIGFESRVSLADGIASTVKSFRESSTERGSSN